jgi:hypothetical protein
LEIQMNYEGRGYSETTTLQLVIIIKGFFFTVQ